MSNNPLADIVAAQTALLSAEIKAEQQKDLRITQQHNAFVQSGIMALWEELKTVLVPHYDDNVKMLRIPLSKFGAYVRRSDLPVGLRFYSATKRPASWICRWREGAIAYTGRTAGVFDSAAAMRKSFIITIAEIVPPHVMEELRVTTKTPAGSRRLLTST